jgi:hypothetical protein
MHSLRTILLTPRWSALLVSVTAFGVYLTTLAPTVGFIDSGELAAVACTLGVAHPTGYPLFTLLGWVFSRLPIAGEEIVRLNSMAAFFCAAGVFFFFHVVHHILRTVAGSGAIQFRNGEMQQTATIVASAGASLLIAFSETYWSQAVSIEVYSLHVLFLSLVTLLFLKAHEQERTAWWLLFAFTLGLAFTNHMTTVLLAPGFLFFYIARKGYRAPAWRKIGVMVPPFLLGLSVYLYLPIRAAAPPVMNWGNTASVERFLWHLSGKQYRVWITFFTESAGRQFAYFRNGLMEEFAYVGVVAAIIGIVVLWRAHRKLAVTTVLLFLTCVLYSINYDIHDIDSYFLLSYIVIGLWAGCGLLFAASLVAGSFRGKAGVTYVCLIMLCLAPLALHHRNTDETQNYLVEDYTRNMFSSVQPDALVLSYQWDYWVSASYYYQLVKGVRPDVAVVDKELLRRSWYLRELAEKFPWLIRHSRAEVEAFEKELYKFEHDLPYTPAVIQARFEEMIASFIRRSLTERPVYVTGEIEPEFTRGYQRVPEGLAIRLFPDSVFHSTPLISYSVRPFQRRGRLEDVIVNLYPNSLILRGKYLHGAGRWAEAREAFQAAANHNPSSVEARQWLRILDRQPQ